jgi:hypothetical protein
MWNRINKTLRIYLVLQNCTFVPRFIYSCLVIISKFFIGINFFFTKNELPKTNSVTYANSVLKFIFTLPSGKSTHCTNKSNSCIIFFNDSLLFFSFKFPRPVAIVCNLNLLNILLSKNQ